MKQCLIIIALLLSTIITKAQTTQIDTAAKKGEVFTLVETTAEFPGGLEKLYAFIYKNLKSYVAEGKEIITFVVEKDGSLTDIKPQKSLSPKADAEAIRVMNLSPKWVPGMQGGKPVRVQYTIPITFGN